MIFQSSRGSVTLLKSPLLQLEVAGTLFIGGAGGGVIRRLFCSVFFSILTVGDRKAGNLILTSLTVLNQSPLVLGM